MLRFTVLFQGILSLLLFLCAIERCATSVSMSPQCSFSFWQLILFGSVLFSNFDLADKCTKTQLKQGLDDKQNGPLLQKRDTQYILHTYNTYYYVSDYNKCLGYLVTRDMSKLNKCQTICTQKEESINTSLERPSQFRIESVFIFPMYYLDNRFPRLA